MSNESNKEHETSKEDCAEPFKKYLESQIGPEIQAAEKMGYTTDQAIELVKPWKLTGELEDIAGSLIWLEPPLNIYPGGYRR